MKVSDWLIILTYRPSHHQELVPGVQVGQECRHGPLISLSASFFSFCNPGRAHLCNCCHLLGDDSFMATYFCKSVNLFKSLELTRPSPSPSPKSKTKIPKSQIERGIGNLDSWLPLMTHGHVQSYNLNM